MNFSIIFHFAALSLRNTFKNFLFSKIEKISLFPLEINQKKNIYEKTHWPMNNS